MNDKKTSPWVWVGCGCFVLVVLGVAGLGGLTWFGVRTAQDIADPERARENALALLGADALPPGYEVELAVDLPFSVELVVLDGGEREFVYMRGIGRSDGLADFADGSLDLLDLLEDAGVNLGGGEALGTERAELGRLTADWVVYRGDIDLQEVQGSGRNNVNWDSHGSEGISAVAVLRCPGDRKLRLGIWRGPDPDPEVGSGALDLTGTTGDPAAVRELLGGFRICG